MKQATSREEHVGVYFINYASQGIALQNQLFIAALRDAQGNVIKFIGALTSIKSPRSDDPECGKALANDKQVDEEQPNCVTQ